MRPEGVLPSSLLWLLTDLRRSTFKVTHREASVPHCKGLSRGCLRSLTTEQLMFLFSRPRHDTGADFTERVYSELNGNPKKIMSMF